MEDELPEKFPLIDATDHEILMHRDVHFGGKFSIMLDYYQQEGKGIQPDFSIERIEALEALEDKFNQNLAVIYLSGPEVEKIAEAKKIYKQLRDIYELKQSKSPYPRLIADLILSEDEEAVEEVQAIVAEKDKIVPHLITLIRTEPFHDPLFPGYGRAPELAIKCLGLIGDKRAIIALFEDMGQNDFFEDDHVVEALIRIGEPAKQFLLKVVRSKPINEDNEKAAIALIGFKDEDVSKACLKLLKDPLILKDHCLSTYLILSCEDLVNSRDRQEFVSMAFDTSLPKQLREDMMAIIHDW